LKADENVWLNSLSHTFSKTIPNQPAKYLLHLFLATVLFKNAKNVDKCQRKRYNVLVRR